MMKVLVAIDSYKESLSSRKISKLIDAYFKRHTFNHVALETLPLADGGEGSLESICPQKNWLYVDVTNPVFHKVEVPYAIVGDTAYIEMAQASGIELLHPQERNPMFTTTLGTGELMKDALDKGVTKMILFIGGSATNDGGLGVFYAFGGKAYDEHGALVEPTCQGAGRAVRLDTTGLDQRLKKCEIQVACDVNNPLTGLEGASYIYGMQKGSSKEMLPWMDSNLQNLAKLYYQSTGKEVENIPGAGAAGGMGAGLLAFTNARLKPGFDLISKTHQLEAKIKAADLIITGEGKMDKQTKFGKVPFGVAALAVKHGKPVVGLAGALGKGYEELYGYGFSALFTIQAGPMSKQDSIKKAGKLIPARIEQIIRLYMIGR